MEINLEKQKEKKEKFPKMELIFLYSSHLTKKDARKIKENLKNVDVYCPEGLNFSEKFIDDLNKISQGDEKVFHRYIFEKKPSDWWQAILEAIYNSKKIIHFVDISEEEGNLSRGIIEMNEKYYEIENYFCSGELKKAIEKLKEYIKENIDLHKQREKIIIENIKRLPQKIISKYPQFKNRKKLRVLLTMGIFHTFLSQEAKKDFTTKSIFIQKPYIYSRIDQAYRSYRFKSKLDFKDEFYGQIFIEEFISRYLNDFLESTDRRTELARIISSKVDFKTIEDISKKLKEDDVISFERPEYITDFLRERGIKIPRNKQEAEKMLREFEKKFSK